MKHFLCLAVAGIVLGTGAGALAADEAPKLSPLDAAARASAARARVQSSPVYTNADLTRRFGAERETTDAPTPAPVAAEDGESQTDDPLAWMRRQEHNDARRQEAVTEAREAVAAAEKRISELQQRVLATKNPFLARPEAPDEEWNELSGAERVERSEAELAAAREELTKARSRLAKLERVP